MSYHTLLLEKQAAVTLIRFNRPEALDALNAQMASELAHAFRTYEDDESQRCAVLTGNSKVFAAGADIKKMQSKGFAQMHGADYFHEINMLPTVRKPWFAAVAGYVLGDLFRGLFATEDKSEGMAAFAAERAPQWQGRWKRWRSTSLLTGFPAAPSLLRARQGHSEVFRR